MAGIEELYGWVHSGQVELAFVSRQDDLKADFLPLKEDTLVAVLPDDRPLMVGKPSRFRPLRTGSF